MALLRRHKDDPGSDRFLMREKLLAIGDDFWIENDQGERAYKVNGKALRVRADVRPGGHARATRWPRSRRRS